MADPTITIIGDSSNVVGDDGSLAPGPVEANSQAIDGIINGNGAFNYSTVGNYRRDSDGAIYQVTYDRLNDKLLAVRVG